MRKLGLLCTAATMVAAGSAHAAVIETYVFDRSSVYSSTEMTRTLSTGESLADVVNVPGLPPNETAAGDFMASFTWSDGTSASGVWAPVSGKNLGGGSPILFPGVEAPGVHFRFGTDPNYRGFIEQSGDTFSDPWEIRNGGKSTYAITQVQLSARGTPDMGFDTNDGNNPSHGAGGFLLRGDDALSTFSGDITVTYNWFNDWNNTTDMFHQLTIDFDTPLAPGTSMVFFQDTDEVAVPVPAGAVLLGSGIALAGIYRRFYKS